MSTVRNLPEKYKLPLLREEDYDQYFYMLFTLPLVLRAKIVVETGLQLGLSTRIFLESAKVGNFSLYTCDINDYPETRERLSKLGLTQNWVFVKMDSVQFGREWNKEPIDLLYLDSHHSFEHVSNELNAWAPHLSDKAVILSHDTNPTLQHEMYKTGGPIGALEKFAEENQQWTLVNLLHPEGIAMAWRRSLRRMTESIGINTLKTL